MSALAADVSLVGLFKDKAVLIVDGGPPRTLAIGARSPEGVRLIAIESSMVQVEVDGQRTRLRIGENTVTTSSVDQRGSASVTLVADGQGHFHTNGMINGAPVRFVVDTGASVVAIGPAIAARAGVNLRNGRPVMMMTANGPAQSVHVKLGKLSIGEIELREVDAAVMPHEIPVALLGMSVLNRMDMKREGETMTLRQRY